MLYQDKNVLYKILNCIVTSFYHKFSILKWPSFMKYDLDFIITIILFYIYLILIYIPKYKNIIYKSNVIDIYFNISGKVNNLAISVLIPIYNKQSYLNISFNSVLNQTLQNLELIAVDDYSQDNSTEIILQKMQKDHRIKLIQHEYNQGTCNTRIHGVLSSSGQYIMSLDPDDLFYLNTTEFSYKAATSLNADVIEILIELRHKTNIIKKWIPCVRNYSQNDKILNDLSVFSFGLLPWNIARKCVKKEIYKRAVNLMLPFVENKHINIAEDLIHCGFVFLYSKNLFCMNFIGYIYNFGLPDNSHTDAYQSATQNQYQKIFGIVLVKYFLNNRRRIENCSLNEFLNSTSNFELYKNITGLVKKPDKNKCNLIKLDGFINIYFEKYGYCVIYKN